MPPSHEVMSSRWIIKDIRENIAYTGVKLRGLLGKQDSANLNGVGHHKKNVSFEKQHKICLQSGLCISLRISEKLESGSD